MATTGGVDRGMRETQIGQAHAELATLVDDLQMVVKQTEERFNAALRPLSPAVAERGPVPGNPPKPPQAAVAQALLDLCERVRVARDHLRNINDRCEL